MTKEFNGWRTYTNHHSPGAQTRKARASQFQSLGKAKGLQMSMIWSLPLQKHDPTSPATALPTQVVTAEK